MKFDTFESKKSKTYGQSFSELVDDYILNPENNELEKLPVKKNIQAKIQSYLDCALERSLERLMPNVVSETEDVAEEYSHTKEDLAILGESLELAEHYRDELGLSPELSASEVFSAVSKHAEDLKNKLASFNKVTKPEEVSFDEKKKNEA